MEQSNRFKFRIWSKNSKKMFYSASHPFSNEWDAKDGTFASAYLYEFTNVATEMLGRLSHVYSLERDDYDTIMQFTGRLDSNGREIFEGDIILIGPANFESKLIDAEESGVDGVQIYEILPDKPLPSPDIVYARAVVEWEEGRSCFSYTYLWQCSEWEERGMSGGSFSYADYTYEVIGNIHDNPDLLVTKP